MITKTRRRGNAGPVRLTRRETAHEIRRFDAINAWREARGYLSRLERQSEEFTS